MVANTYAHTGNSRAENWLCAQHVRTPVLAKPCYSNGHSPKPRTVPPRKKVWKLRDSIVCKDYETFVNEKCMELISNKKPEGVNDAWNKV